MTSVATQISDTQCGTECCDYSSFSLCTTGKYWMGSITLYCIATHLVYDPNPVIVKILPLVPDNDIEPVPEPKQVVY